MPEPLNVFDHQRFRLRTTTGERVEKSFRDLLTEPDAPYALAYAQPFYDIAALNLLTFLAQYVFEPETPAELARRVATPMSEAAFEEAVAPLRARFALTGDGPRFMQAPAPEDPKKGEALDVAVFIAPKGDRQFLHRADADWAVSPEQAGLFLFARNTFYEGTGGRGYQKGTNGDTPVRTLVTLPAPGDTLWLRKSLWLNVLTRQQQREYPGEYADREDAGAYDGLFWVDPPKGDVPVGGITLRAGLGWMTAFHWLWHEELETPGVCPLTGERVTGFAARRATKRSTGIAYGAKGDLESGVRADRLFRHPNVPVEVRRDEKKDEITRRPFMVDRTKGLVEAVGGSFFGGRPRQGRAPYELAPAVDQLRTPAIQKLGLSPHVTAFGFHMLSGQKNVHGGIEQDTFRFRPIADDLPDALAVMDLAAARMHAAGALASQAAYELQRAVQRTAGAGVRAEETDDGRISLKKLEKTPAVDDPFGRDVLTSFWRATQQHLVEHAGRIAEESAAGASAFAEQEFALAAAWENTVIAEARRQYRPVFEHYSTLPRTMPYAHAAQRLLNAALAKLRTSQPAEA